MARSVAVIAAEGSGAADGAFPGEVAKKGQHSHLRPSPAVQPAKVARAAVFADSLAQRIDLLIRLAPREGVPIFVAPC